MIFCGRRSSDFEILRFQIRDLAALGVGDHRVHLNQVHRDANYSARAGLLRSLREGGHQTDKQKNEVFAHG